MKLAQLEQRSFPRIPMRLAVYLKLIKGPCYHGYSRNISMGGIFMESEEFFTKDIYPTPGDSGELTLYYKDLQDTTQTFSAHCRLPYVLHDGIGVCFSELEPTARQQLQAILSGKISLPKV